MNYRNTYKITYHWYELRDPEEKYCCHTNIPQNIKKKKRK